MKHHSSMITSLWEYFSFFAFPSGVWLSLRLLDRRCLGMSSGILNARGRSNCGCPRGPWRHNSAKTNVNDNAMCRRLIILYLWGNQNVSIPFFCTVRNDAGQTCRCRKLRYHSQQRIPPSRCVLSSSHAVGHRFLFSRALLIARSDSTSHSAMLSSGLSVCSRTPPPHMIGWAERGYQGEHFWK